MWTIPGAVELENTFHHDIFTLFGGSGRVCFSTESKARSKLDYGLDVTIEC